MNFLVINHTHTTSCTCSYTNSSHVTITCLVFELCTLCLSACADLVMTIAVLFAHSLQNGIPSYYSVYDQANYLIFAEFTKKKFFFPQCNCSVDYDDLQFHIVGHYVHCSMEFMWSQLKSYMQTCISGVKIVGEKLLVSKGLAVKDYISYILQEHNRGDELSLYLMSRMIQKHVCVIGKNSVWYTSCCKDKDQEITVADCQIVLVYLGAGTVWDTKHIAAAAKNSSPKSNPKLPLSSGEEYSPRPPQCTTQLLKDAAQDQWGWLKPNCLNLLLQDWNLMVNHPYLMYQILNLQVSLKSQNPSLNITLATQENLALLGRKLDETFTKI